jgi:hypothetical protein
MGKGNATSLPEDKVEDPVVRDVKTAQKKWADAILKGDPCEVTKLYATNGKDTWHHDSPSSTFKNENTNLAFNPTLDDRFLTTQEETLEYFKGTVDEPGFAMKRWTRVIFEPTEHPKAVRFITKFSECIIAVGRYIFEKEEVVLDPTGEKLLAPYRQAVDYTFVYKRIGENLIIIAHHSSLPLSQKLK